VAPPAGDQAERRLDLPEDGRFARGEAHVARQDELAAGAADATFDLRDGDEATGAEVAEQGSDGGFAGQLRRLGPVLGDPRQIDVRDEVVRVGAREHDDVARGVRLGALDQGDEVTDELGPEKVHRRRRDLGNDDARIDAHADRLERPGIRCRRDRHEPAAIVSRMIEAYSAGASSQTK
jgi:hypothetical protein